MRVISFVYIFILILMSFAHLLGLDLGATPHVYTLKDFYLPISFISSSLFVFMSFYKIKSYWLFQFVIVLSLATTSWFLLEDYFKGVSVDDAFYYLTFRSLFLISLLLFNVHFIWKFSFGEKQQIT